MLLPLQLNGLNLDSETAVAVFTGSLTEVQAVAGGQVFTLTLTNDTFVAAGTGPIGSTANTQALIDGIVSNLSETNGWNAKRSLIATTDIVRTSNTVATLTLPALTGFDITTDEALTWTVPAAVLTGASPLVAVNAVTVSATVVASTRKKGRRKPKRYVVEVDGQDIVVNSISAAEALLEQARDLAKESAPVDTRRAPPNVSVKPPRVGVKTGSGKPTTSVSLQRSIQDTQAAVNAIYRKAEKEIAQERELSLLLQSKLQQEDDEEAIAVLLL